MNKIAITKEHEIKLLRMCKDLFPEYEDVMFSSFLDINENVIYTSDLMFFKKDEEGFVINWLEFCLTQLTRRISENFEVVDTLEKHRQIFDILVKKLSGIYPVFKNNQNNHPVDYLYEMYEKTLKE